MPLLGAHTQNPNGDPNVIAGLQSLAARAKAGDASAAALIQKVANGTPVNGSDLIPGWNVGMVSWGNPTTMAAAGHAGQSGVRYWGNEGGRQAEQQAAQNLLQGGDDNAQLAAANASHKDWTGGTLASLAPLAVGLIPGVGPLAAMGLGAAAGGLESAGGVTNNSVLAGAASGAAEGAAGNKLFQSGTPAGTAVGASGAAAASQPGFLQKLGSFVTQPNMLGNSSGQLDLGKTLGLAGGVANVAGTLQNNSRANAYNQSNIDVRNNLLSRILGGNSGSGGTPYNFAPGQSGSQPAPLNPNPMAPRPPQPQAQAMPKTYGAAQQPQAPQITGSL